MHDQSMNRRFHSQGFTHVGGFLSPFELNELESSHEDLTSIARGILLQAKRTQASLAELYRASDEKLIVVPERDRPMDICRLEYLAGANGAIRKLVDDRILPLVESVLGEKCVLFKDKCNEKLPGGGAFPPHQDMAAYHVFPPRFFITAMIALDEATAENGCLYFGGNYKRIRERASLDFEVGEYPVFKYHRAGPENGNINEAVCSKFDWTAVPAMRGDVVVFDAFVPHYSEPNRSISPRRALFFTFNKFHDGDHYEYYYAQKRQAYDSPVFHVATPTVHSSTSSSSQIGGVAS